MIRVFIYHCSRKETIMLHDSRTAISMTLYKVTKMLFVFIGSTTVEVCKFSLLS